MSTVVFIDARRPGSDIAASGTASAVPLPRNTDGIRNEFSRIGATIEPDFIPIRTRPQPACRRRALRASASRPSPPSRRRLRDRAGDRLARQRGVAAGADAERQGAEDAGLGDAVRLDEAARRIRAPPTNSGRIDAPAPCCTISRIVSWSLSSISTLSSMPRPASSASIAARSPSPRISGVRRSSSPLDDARPAARRAASPAPSPPRRAGSRRSAGCATIPTAARCRPGRR